MKMADGSVQVDVQLDDDIYYQILSEYVGLPIEGEYQLMQTLTQLAAMQKEYEKGIRNAHAGAARRAMGL